MGSVELGELTRIDQGDKFGAGDEAMSDEIWASGKASLQSKMLRITF